MTYSSHQFVRYVKQSLLGMDKENSSNTHGNLVTIQNPDLLCYRCNSIDLIKG